MRFAELVHTADQFLIFLLIRGIVSHKAGGMNAGGAVQGVDHKAGVIRDRHLAAGKGDRLCLYDRVLLERRAVLDDIGTDSRFLHGQDLHVKILQNLTDLPHLIFISGRHYQMLLHSSALLLYAFRQTFVPYVFCVFSQALPFLLI